jgi:1-acyl-sn-glycerol-3-phosphate acyltransferase
MERTNGEQTFTFHLPWRLTPGLVLDLLRGRPRSLARDCRAMVARMRPVPRVIGVRAIPQQGPFVLVANHFSGPDLWIGWTAALLTHAVARARSGGIPENAPAIPVYWLVDADLNRSEPRGWRRIAPATGWTLRRLARVWGMVPLPRDGSSMARANTLRRMIRLASPPPSGDGQPIGLFPEGEGHGLTGLRPVPDAAGDLLALLARRDIPILPAAVWFDQGRLTARIGKPFRPSGAGRATADEVIVRVGALLPREMWGAYADSIQRHLTRGHGR